MSKEEQGAGGAAELGQGQTMQKPGFYPQGKGVGE